MRKKLSARWISVLSALALLFTLMPTSLSAAADDIKEHITVISDEIEIDENLFDGAEVQNGDDFEITMHFEIDNDYEYDEDEGIIGFNWPLTSNGVKLANLVAGEKGALVSTTYGTVGTFFFKDDGTIDFEIDNVGYLKDSDRTFGITFKAIVDVEVSETGEPSEVEIVIDEARVNVTVSFPDSTLEGEKVAVEEDDPDDPEKKAFWYDPETKTVYQRYRIKLTARGGKVTGAEVWDHMGEGLEAPEEVTLIRGTDEESLDVRPEPHAFRVTIEEIGKDETVYLEYVLPVSSEYYFYSGEFSNGIPNDSNIKNKFSNSFDVDFTSQNGTKGELGEGARVYPVRNSASLAKEGEIWYDSNAQEWKVTWKITVDPGIFDTGDEEGIHALFYGSGSDHILDEPGEGHDDTRPFEIYDDDFEYDEETHTFTFTGDGSGYYERVLDELTAALLESGFREVTITNDVTLGEDDSVLRTTGKATREAIGIGYLTKAATSNTANEDGRFGWEASFTIPVDNISSVEFTDNCAVTSGSIVSDAHSFVKDTIKINDIPIAELESAGDVECVISADKKSLSIKFSESCLKKLADDADDRFVSVNITYETEPDDASLLSDTYNVLNSAVLEFVDETDGTRLSSGGRASYSQTVKAEKYFVKKNTDPYDWSGSSSNKFNEDQGDWVIEIGKYLSELTVGDKFTIRDIPEKMEIIEDSATPYIVHYWYNDYPKRLSEINVDEDSVLTCTNNGNGTYTFVFTVTQELYDTATEIAGEWDQDNFTFAICYFTRVTNLDELAAASSLEYTNSIDGTYNTNRSAKDTVKRTFTHKKEITKKDIYEQNNELMNKGSSGGKVNLLYEVEINPASVMLGDKGELKVVDTMTGVLAIPESVIIHDVHADKDLAAGKDYKLDFDPEAHQMTFTVPNGRYLKLSYMAEIEAEVGSDYVAKNDIEIVASAASKYSANNTSENVVMKVSGYADAGNKAIDIAKYGKLGGSTIFPEGAKFEVVQVLYNEDTQEFEVAGSQLDADIRIIYDKNIAKITNLQSDKIYRLTEVESPAGYKCSDEPLYFIFTGNDGKTLPPGVENFEGKSTHYYENEPLTVTINKVEIASGNEVDGAKLEVRDKDGNLVGEWTSKEGETWTIEGLISGEDYTLTETLTPDDYLTAAKTTFTVDQYGKVTVVKGSDAKVEDGILLINDTKKTTDDSSDSSSEDDLTNSSDSSSGNDSANSSNSSGNDSANSSNSSGNDSANSSNSSSGNDSANSSNADGGNDPGSVAGDDGSSTAPQRPDDSGPGASTGEGDEGGDGGQSNSGVDTDTDVKGEEDSSRPDDEDSAGDKSDDSNNKSDNDDKSDDDSKSDNDDKSDDSNSDGKKDDSSGSTDKDKKDKANNESKSQTNTTNSGSSGNPTTGSATAGASVMFALAAAIAVISKKKE